MTTSPPPSAPLDAWRDPERDVRIHVARWLATEPVTGQFVIRPRSAGMVWNYLRHIGPRAVLRKIRSRMAETGRNRKIAGIGVGTVTEAPANSRLRPGVPVVFFAPNHSASSRNVVVDCSLAASITGSAGGLGPATLSARMKETMGWSPFSGLVIDHAKLNDELRAIGASLSAPNVAAVELPPRERREIGAIASDRPSAVIFGLGNYAKTQIVAPVRRYLRLAAVHEVDPDQLATAASWNVTMDTSPSARADERYDAWFIAGYHHTHASLAAHALRSGAYAVVEKPVATTPAQLDELASVWGPDAPSRLFSCFHKRYSRLNDWARRDLGVRPGEPIDMHSIVYEIPLPPLHWYNWPNSGSRLISNGCHWLDYFLYMNEFSEVARFDVHPLRGSDLTAVAQLRNGAQCTMVITDTGSERLGVRDVIELRARDVTVRLIDATYYESENSRTTLRRRRVNPMDAYARMYETICRRIVERGAGDPWHSLRSTRLSLDMEAVLRAESPRAFTHQVTDIT